MAQFTNVDPELLAAQGRHFDSAGANSKQVALTLHDLIGSLGECWGRDETGRAFLTTYGKERDLLVDGLYGVEGLLDDIAGGLQTMAKLYREANDANQNTVS
jgi:hypothetical protein